MVQQLGDDQLGDIVIMEPKKPPLQRRSDGLEGGGHRGGGIDSGLWPTHLRGCASLSLCLFEAVELRSSSHPLI